MTLEKVCALASRCKKAGQAEFCNVTCFPYVVMHGSSGNGGLWAATNVPKKYRDCFGHNLPKSMETENPEAYEVIQKYLKFIIPLVHQGMGLYLYSRPSNENPLGTGTGKTTAAVTILNEYVLARVIQHVTNQEKIKEVPGLFVRAADLQNLYNSLFRGNDEMREKAAQRYYRLKELMKNVELLVIDDIAIRDATEAYLNELFEIIDARDTKRLALIFTSNLSLKGLAATLGDRIASRIAGMTEQIELNGKDHRRRGIL